MHYEVSKDGFTLWSLLDLQTFEAFQGSYSSPILNHTFDFWLAEKYFEPSWKSSPAKIGLAGLVLPPLLQCKFCCCHVVHCYAIVASPVDPQNLSLRDNLSALKISCSLYGKAIISHQYVSLYSHLNCT